MADPNIPIPPPDKPGWTTSGFWATLAAQVVGVLTLAGVLPAGLPAKYQQWVDLGVPVAAMLAAGAYALSRGRVNAARVAARAQFATNALSHARFLAELDRVPPAVPKGSGPFA